MVEDFRQRLFQLISKDDRILLAVSGGMDSTLMCHLFHEMGIDFGVAHCNFMLRGEASDSDEQFVEALANGWGVPFFMKRFDTNKMLEKEKGSVQMVARQLRYDWLEEIRSDNQYQYIATAHHLNDSIETAMFNFTKGTGLRGLRGILPKNGTIIRPLIDVSKKRIEEEVEKRNLKFREDASNLEDKYQRNKIRHHVVPNLQEINPSLEKTMLENFNRLQELESFFDFFLQNVKSKIIQEKNNGIQFDKKELNRYPFKKTILFEILKDYGFSSGQVEDVIQIMQGVSGKKIMSENYILVNDRDFLLLENISDDENLEFEITRNCKSLQLNNGKLFFENIERLNVFPENNLEAYFDVDVLDFPLKLRRKREGDFFYPLGMKGKKKTLKKFFIDHKLSILDKKKVWVLESAGKIVWVLGMRSDDRFKITGKTNSILRIVFKG